MRKEIIYGILCLFIASFSFSALLGFMKGTIIKRMNLVDIIYVPLWNPLAIVNPTEIQTVNCKLTNPFSEVKGQMTLAQEMHCEIVK